MKITDQQTRIKPKFAVTSPYKVRLMPQRYMPDAEVLQEMVDYESNPTLRAVPTGLDVMAAIGIPAAERILIQELKEQGELEPVHTQSPSHETTDGYHRLGPDGCQ